MSLHQASKLHVQLLQQAHATHTAHHTLICKTCIAVLCLCHAGSAAHSLSVLTNLSDVPFLLRISIYPTQDCRVAQTACLCQSAPSANQFCPIGLKMSSHVLLPYSKAYKPTLSPSFRCSSSDFHVDKLAVMQHAGSRETWVAAGTIFLDVLIWKASRQGHASVPLYRLKGHEGSIHRSYLLFNHELPPRPSCI